MHILPYQQAAHFSESARSHLRDGQGVPRCKPKQEFVMIFFVKLILKTSYFLKINILTFMGPAVRSRTPFFQVITSDPVQIF